MKDLRKKMGYPTFMAGVEKAVNSSPEVRKRMEMIRERLAKTAGSAKAPRSKK